ncbi:MAG: peptidoglycan DD-metalloendopeptidase family protein [Phormidesmis sp.]
MSDSSHSCIQEVCQSTAASSSSIKSAAMLGLALSVGASGVFTAQSEASAAISVPETATAQAFSSDFKVSIPSASQAQIVAYHTVESGQSLWQIAQLHRVGLQDLKAANELPAETSIRVGQVLKVPGAAVVTQPPAQKAIHNLIAPEGGSAGLITANQSALENAETVARAKISEQSQPAEELASASQIVPQLDEAQVSVEIASAYIELDHSAETSADSANVESANVESANVESAKVATAEVAATEVVTAERAVIQPVAPPASVEIEIADASLAEQADVVESAPVVAALATPAQPFASYQVQSGDTIASIASSLGTTAADLISANGLVDPDIIMTGATLIVPATSGEKVSRRIDQPSDVGSVTGRSSGGRLTHLQSTVIRQSATDAEEQSSADAPASQAAQGGIDPYVANLLEEVQEIQSKPVRVAEAQITEIESRAAQNPRTANRVAIAPTAASVADPTLLAAAPLSPDAYVPAQRQPAGQGVSPDMPLLPEAGEFLPEAPDYFNGYIWPTRGTLTSGYGWRWGRMHRGVDVAGPVGTPVVAAGSGVVENAGWNSGGYGNMVEIRHPDGSLTLYAHNNRLNVSTGQAVKQGQKIAEMGSTGYSTGPHLHFEVHLNGKDAVNPVAYLPSR